jgi:hypothetical protein
MTPFSSPERMILETEGVERTVCATIVSSVLDSHTMYTGITHYVSLSLNHLAALGTSPFLPTLNPISKYL